MREKSIPDELIPSADPAAVVEQYRPFIRKTARKYWRVVQRSGAVDFDDLEQIGSIAILNAKQHYDPSGGASFLGYADYWIRSAMRRALGYNSNTGELPPLVVSLDETIPGTDDLRRMDVLPDLDAIPIDEPIINDETRRETVTEVREAVSRLKNERQREILERIYFDGRQRKAIASDLGITSQGISVHEHAAYRTLRADKRLRQFADEMPFLHISKSRFNTTWTSATEAAAIWRDEHLPKPAENLADEPAQGRQWSAARWMAYAEKIRKRHREQAATGS